MPFVRVSWFSGRDREQKARISEAITKAFVEIAKTSPEHVWIVYEDVPKSDWSMGGKLCG